MVTKTLMALVLFCGLGVADAADPIMQRGEDGGVPLSEDGVLPRDVLCYFFIGRYECAAHEEELGDIAGNDPPFQETVLMPGSAIAAARLKSGDCYLTPLLCLLKSSTPDLRCVYTCIGSRGRGEVSHRQLTACDFLAGCMLFENCLALCVSIIPYNMQPVLWW